MPLIVDIALPAIRLESIYRGDANRLMLRARDGRRVSLPAHHMRPFIDHRGLYGSFELECTAEGRLLAVRRLEEGGRV